MNHFFKSLFILIFLAVLIAPDAHSQYLLETADRFTNSLRNGTPREEVYLAIGFTREMRPYFFGDSGESLVTILYENGEKEEKAITGKDIFNNRKTRLLEYFYHLSANTELDKLSPMEFYMSSTDGRNYTKISISRRDIKKLIKLYEPPKPGASMKERAKYFRKTGNSQGMLLGANNDVVWSKRTKCSVKKRKYGKDGVNGVKEMTYGMN